jgi:hypothetical protein
MARLGICRGVNTLPPQNETDATVRMRQDKKECEGLPVTDNPMTGREGKNS